MDKISTLKDNVINAIFKFPLISLTILFVLFISRGYEYLIISQGNTTNPETIGFLLDIFFYFKISAFLIIPFIIFYLIRPLIGKLFFLSSIILITIIHIILMMYFIFTDNLLNAEIFDYTLIEIIESIIISELNLGIFYFLPLIIIIIISIVLFFILNTISVSKYFHLGYYIIMLSAIIVSATLNINKESVIAYNKSNYFINNTIDYLIINLMDASYSEEKIVVKQNNVNIKKSDTLSNNDTIITKKKILDNLKSSIDTIVPIKKTIKKEIDKPEYIYTIQIMSSNKPGGVDKNIISKRFNISDPINETFIDGKYKYTIGEFSNKDECITYKNDVIKKYNIKGAFITKLPRRSN